MKFLSCCVVLLWPTFAPGQDLHKLFSEYYEDQLKENPEFATREGRNEYNHLWKDWSKRALERQHRGFENYLTRVQQVSLSGIPEQDQVSVRLLRYHLRQILDGERSEAHV